MEEETSESSIFGVSRRSIGKTVGIVAAGALAGVGVVAAAPVFGAVGVVTGVGALVGGLGGAAMGGGVAYATDDSDGHAQAVTAAMNIAAAKHTAQLDAMAKRYAELKRMHDAQLKYNDICLELYRVAIACLKVCNAAGDENLLKQVREYVFGAAHATLPWHIEVELELIDPPNLGSALARARKVAPAADALVDATVELIAVLADADGGHGLLPRWTQLRAA